jgi:hypothetical protein
MISKYSTRRCMVSLFAKPFWYVVIYITPPPEMKVLSQHFQKEELTY